MKIQILSEQMASRIAAGEVVERPASVVKELMENALDAGATEISVELEKSGTSLIRVTDDGQGMTPEDLSLAVERHSTSKLKTEDDLFSISTLGFRGEALPSIASVSRFEITSRDRAAEIAHRLPVEGGRKQALRPIAAPPGTIVQVRDLFFNTPARRKFLKAPSTELSHICDVFNRLALANPPVHFRLKHDGRIVADHVSVGEAKDRLYQILGRDTARGLAPFAWNRGDLTLTGHLSIAPVSFPNSRYLFTFVNGRYVRDKVLTHAVIFGYETLLMKGQYPAVVLFLRIPFQDVDVNVHPAKYEVRFRRQSEIHQAVADAIRSALKLEAKGSSPVSVPGRAPVFNGVMEAAFDYGVIRRPDMAVTATSSPMGAAPAEEPPAAGFFSSMRILDQILGCYLVCSSARGLVIIDQHAAHERVMFEKLRQQMEQGNVQRQALLMPQSLELAAGESMLLEKSIPALEELGFTIEPFGPKNHAITAIPALFPEGDYRQWVRELVSELAEVDHSNKLRQRVEDRLATIACHSVIRANRDLEIPEMRALLRELDGIDFATQCPHGRPVLIEFTRDQLDRMFKRLA